MFQTLEATLGKGFVECRIQSIFFVKMETETLNLTNFSLAIVVTVLSSLFFSAQCSNLPDRQRASDLHDPASPQRHRHHTNRKRYPNPGGPLNLLLLRGRTTRWGRAVRGPRGTAWSLNPRQLCQERWREWRWEQKA